MPAFVSNASSVIERNRMGREVRGRNEIEIHTEILDLRHAAECVA